LVNSYLESSISDIYAAGDVAQVPDWISGQKITQTSWFNSTWQGTVAGTNMVNRESTPYKDISYNYIDIYALNQTSFGSIHPKLADEILTGDYPKGNDYKKLFVRQNKLIGGMFLTEEMEDLWGYVDVIKAQLDIGPFKSELLKKEFDIKAIGKRAEND
jgi:NADPH-dependent 2,4-dienoyl-CoA reductase/sulfur reductase-like enzyme